MNNDLISRSALTAEFKRLGLGEHGLVERLFADGVYAVIETIPAVDAGPKWISTAERLPVEEAVQHIRQHEELPEYLVWIKGGAAPTTLYFTGDAFVDDECTPYSVTHWMPLPDLPKEG